ARGGDRETMAFPDWSPRVDVSETPEAYLIQAELPQVKKEDMKLSVENGVLRITGERKQQKEEKDKKYHRIERSYGSFMRSFTLPDDTDSDHIQAEVKDGVLSIKLQKLPQKSPASKQVQIK